MMDLSAQNSGFIRPKLWYQSPEMRVKEKIKFSNTTVHESCNIVVEKIVKISLLFGICVSGLTHP
jgi:hypothetical protein